MIDIFPFAGLPVAVFGLGHSGLTAAQALQTSGAEVHGWDDNEKVRADAEAAGVAMDNLYDMDWAEMTALIVSPGIPLDFPAPHPIVTLARAAGVEVIGDIELLARSMRNAAYVGITGTNGKSTTTALIGHILSVSGRPTEIGGNIGTPALSLAALDEDGIYVLEMSSYQLDLTRSITFDIAVLLNISADHLDRHGGMDGYIAAKKTIFRRQTRPRTAVIGVDDEITRTIYKELKAAGDQVIIPVSGLGPVTGGVYVDGGILYDDTGADTNHGDPVAILDLDDVTSLPGVHNAQNAAAAYAVAKSAGTQPAAIMASIKSFPGLAHRQELLAIIDGVAYINDSKATNGVAASRALACYGNVYWIAGGRAKEGGIEAVMPYLDRVRHAYLIGETANDFAATLDGRVPCMLSGELSSAVGQARETALDEIGDGAVVLLSPACASFDQFANFECRGDAFRALVEALPGVREDISQIGGISA
ncbi:MAG: UDP-N-acetylmuramoyl-L-alanine--D-glutamate ligase [Rhodospirillaceae bacterium]|nr:UDP-N-acetylmuramoyl-L-alanine--D-glutamate ligase [Rhodospirillaceae bacterium]